MSKNYARLAIALAAATVLGNSAYAKPNPMVGGAAMYPTRTVVENAVNSKDHTTLVAAVKAGVIHVIDTVLLP